MIWFNTPYGANVKTNVDKFFMRLVDKHFPCHHKYYKLFGRNNIKISYSCMPSMNNSKIRKFYKKHFILFAYLNIRLKIRWTSFGLSFLLFSTDNVNRKYNSKIIKDCNCRGKADCPMDGNCLSKCLIHKASVNITTNKYYYVTCENTFTERYNNHECSYKSSEKNTELSKYVWKLKEKNINYFIDWDIAVKSQKFVCESRKCDFCICEKLFIARADPNVLLN